MDNNKVFEENIKLIQQFVNDPVQRRHALNLAMQIEQISRNWFTPEFVAKKGKRSVEDVIKKLAILKVFGLATSRKISDSEVKFKITIDNKSKINAIDNQISELKQHINTLEKEKESLLIEKPKKETKIIGIND